LFYVLDPGLLREATYHGFLPAGTPMWPALALVTLPHVHAVIYVLRSHRVSLPRWRVLLPIAAAILIAAGATAMIAPSPRCDGAAFRAHGLQCEVVQRNRR
jgi:hypothetical protein